MFLTILKKEASMKSSVLWGLVGLNAVLLFAYIGQFARPSAADAQMRRPSDYLLIPGTVAVGSIPEVVYVVDTTTGKLGCVAYDDSSRLVTTMPPINLNTIFSAAQPAGIPTPGYR
jgi:hypothetical protein